MAHDGQTGLTVRTESLTPTTVLDTPTSVPARNRSALGACFPTHLQDRRGDDGDQEDVEEDRSDARGHERGDEASGGAVAAAEAPTMRPTRRSTMR